MKKTIIIVVIILLTGLIGIVSYKYINNDSNTNTVQPTKPEPEVIIYYTKEEAKARLKEIAEDIYQNQKYLNYPKEDGIYFISLKEIRNVLKYDTKKIDYIDGLKCDEIETGIGIDVDNLDHTVYYGSPVVTYMLCNPPKTEE